MAAQSPFNYLRGAPRAVIDLEISFVDDVINEPQETFVGFIEIEDAVDTSKIEIGRRATQLIITDNDSERISSETSAV